MVETTPELRAALDVAKQRISVDGYYTKTVTKGLFGHAKGYVGGAMLGFATGGLAALTCAGAMLLAHIALPVSLGALILGGAGIGVATGGTVGSRVGASAGAVSAGLEERERRDKAEKLEQEVLASPEKQREVIEAYRKNPVVEKSATINELYATHSRSAAMKKMFDVKTILFAGLVCAAVGAAVCAGGFLLASVVTGQTFSLGWGALVASCPWDAAVIGAGLGAASGASFGIAYPAIFGTLTQKASDMLTGKMIRGKSDFSRAKTIAEIQHEAVANRAASETLQAASAYDDALPMQTPLVREIPLTRIEKPIAADRPMMADQQVAM